MQTLYEIGFQAWALLWTPVLIWSVAMILLMGVLRLIPSRYPPASSRSKARGAARVAGSGPAFHDKCLDSGDDDSRSLLLQPVLDDSVCFFCRSHPVARIVPVYLATRSGRDDSGLNFLFGLWYRAIGCWSHASEDDFEECPGGRPGPSGPAVPRSPDHGFVVRPGIHTILYGPV